MMIQSLLDTDLYKFTMMQTVLHHFPAAEVEYQFKCRSKGIDLRPYTEEISAAVDHLCQLKFQKAELDYLRSLRFLKADFIEFLRIFSLNRNFVSITAEKELAITIRGPWLHTILFEVPLLAIVSEIYFKHQTNHANETAGSVRLAEKIQQIQQHADNADFKFSDFGTRRRFSRDWQSQVVQQLAQALPQYFFGTSNVYLAQKFNLKPMGTMAHEYLQACQALGVRLVDSQKFALNTWVQEYRGDLGIALTDVVGVDAFLRDFDLFFCKLFDGVRHDSGDPFEWGEKMLAHYKKMRIDAKQKTLVFSDGLTVPQSLALYDHFKNRAQVAFGIGTNLTNDVGFEPLQIVIKMVRCNGQPVAKLSDSPGKTMCLDEVYLAYVRQVFSLEQV